MSATVTRVPSSRRSAYLVRTTWQTIPNDYFVTRGNSNNILVTVTREFLSVLSWFWKRTTSCCSILEQQMEQHMLIQNVVSKCLEQHFTQLFGTKSWSKCCSSPFDQHFGSTSCVYTTFVVVDGDVDQDVVPIHLEQHFDTTNVVSYSVSNNKCCVDCCTNVEWVWNNIRL